MADKPSSAINAQLRAVITTQAARVAEVVSEIAQYARAESLHYVIALAAISALWEACKGHVGSFTAAISELASDVHATCEAQGIGIGRRPKGDDGGKDDDAARRERGRVNTFLSQFRVIARKVAETNGTYDLDRPFWQCYEGAKAAGTGSNRNKKSEAPTALAAHPAKELAAALGELARTDDAALIEAFRMLTGALAARKATIDVSAITAIGKRFGVQ